MSIWRESSDNIIFTDIFPVPFVVRERFSPVEVLSSRTLTEKVGDIYCYREQSSTFPCAFHQRK